MVRMGEFAGTGQEDDVLVAIGLGSCVGLALLDHAKGVAGLAHVMLPSAQADAAGVPGKYADHAVPALIELTTSLGARRARLEAVLVGGACMFSFASNGGNLDVGSRNEAAVRAALAEQRIPVRAAATAGSIGRTMRVHPASGLVTVRCAGAAVEDLWAPIGTASVAGRLA